MATNNTVPQAVTLKITLTPELVEKVHFLRGSDTFEEEVLASVKFGIENRAYRKGYMAKRNAERKQLPAQLSKAQGRIAELEAKLKQLAAKATTTATETK